jgi:cellulose synthase/poly-beta-1,6-N-acetylglucosamine synthase-like glycosyltransferase
MEPFVFTVSLFFFTCYTILITYYRQSWLSIHDFEASRNTQPRTKISVIMPARNEEYNIAACLESIIQQSYPAYLYEILVVDDHSTDNTAKIVSKYLDQNVRLISLKDFVSANEINSYKKKAIETAIQQATGELIVTTDADCIVPPNWLKNIGAFYEEKKPVFIVMPVAIMCNNRPIEIFQSLDFMVLQGITGASVHRKFHSMCNGANLAYTKKAFEEVDGFKGIDGIASGDDMLLLHKIFKRHPDGIAYLKNSDVIVQTEPVKSIAQFFNQRIRWASKADRYDDKRIFAVLLLVYFFNVWLIVLGIVAIFFPFAYFFYCIVDRQNNC